MRMGLAAAAGLVALAAAVGMGRAAEGVMAEPGSRPAATAPAPRPPTPRLSPQAAERRARTQAFVAAWEQQQAARREAGGPATTQCMSNPYESTWGVIGRPLSEIRADYHALDPSTICNGGPGEIGPLVCPREKQATLAVTIGTCEAKIACPAQPRTCGPGATRQ